MVDNYYIPQKITVVAPKPVNQPAVRQAVQEAVRAALPPIQNNSGSVNLYITVHIHL